MENRERRENEPLIVNSKLKGYIKSKGCILSQEAYEELNHLVYQIIDRAIERTQENRRTTVRAQDI